LLDKLWFMFGGLKNLNVKAFKLLVISEDAMFLKMIKMYALKKILEKRILML